MTAECINQQFRTEMSMSTVMVILICIIELSGNKRLLLLLSLQFMALTQCNSHPAEYFVY